MTGWEEVAWGMIQMLAQRRVSPVVAESWLWSLLEYAEMVEQQERPSGL